MEKLKAKFRVLRNYVVAFFVTVFSKEKSRQFIKEHLFNPHHSAQLKASSIGFGVFMGIIPIWGFQLIAAFLLAVPLRLNKALVILATHISFAPMIPLVIFLSYKAGGWWMVDKTVDIPFSHNITLKLISLHLKQYLYGSISLAITAGLFAGLLTYALLKLFTRKTTAA